MSNPPTPSAPPPAPPSPSPGYPPYPPYPWYPSPPSRDHTALIIVIIVLVVAAWIAVPAVLYLMVSGLTSGPEEVDYPALLTPELTNGNATISIGSASPEFSPERLEIVLRANTSLSAVDVPPSDESVLVNMTDYGLRLTWLDHNQDGIVGPSDEFRITGDFAPLPPATSFEFIVIISFPSGRGWDWVSIGWTTP